MFLNQNHSKLVCFFIYFASIVGFGSLIQSLVLTGMQLQFVEKKGEKSMLSRTVLCFSIFIDETENRNDQNGWYISFVISVCHYLKKEHIKKLMKGTVITKRIQTL